MCTALPSLHKAAGRLQRCVAQLLDPTGTSVLLAAGTTSSRDTRHSPCKCKQRCCRWRLDRRRLLLPELVDHSAQRQQALVDEAALHALALVDLSLCHTGDGRQQPGAECWLLAPAATHAAPKRAASTAQGTLCSSIPPHSMPIHSGPCALHNSAQARGGQGAAWGLAPLPTQTPPGR